MDAQMTTKYSYWIRTNLVLVSGEIGGKFSYKRLTTFQTILHLLRIKRYYAPTELKPGEDK